MRYTKWFTFQNGFIGFTAARFQGRCRPIPYGQQVDADMQPQQDSTDPDQTRSNMDQNENE